jgi:lipopolysaccharide transport system permease protein
VAPPVLAIQDALFWGRWPAGGDVLYTAVAAALALLVGWHVFRRMEREMAVEL